MASCCETEESQNGRVRRASDVHKHTVSAGESKNPKDHKKPSSQETTRYFHQMVYKHDILLPTTL